jgi:hypothetical protein
MAIGCQGTSSSGFGLNVWIANSCRGYSSSGTPEFSSFRCNMP